VHTVVVRVWLPDRPGALGQIASRIGAVRGDVLAIEILEVGAGSVIDELVVSLPDASLVDLMVAEVHAIDGVSVEHVRPTVHEHRDGGLMALALAADLAEADPAERPRELVSLAAQLTDATWAMLVSDHDVIASTGEVPAAEWVTSLLAGSKHLDDPHATSSDMFWADLPFAGMWLAAGREGRQVHERERVRLDLFARIADALLEPDDG
jgi:hypothetical protein